MTGTQMGKTDTICNVIGQRLDDDPVPFLYIAPTRTFVEETFEPRLVAMIDSSESLAPKMARGKQERITMKRVAGVRVRLGWAGSATSLAGEAACKVLLDEVDRMSEDVMGEGDPVELAHERHSTYPDGQAGVFSTCTLGRVETFQHPETGLFHWERQEDPEAIQSAIWHRWQEGTRHEWMWSCPDCEKPFAPQLDYLVWPKESTGLSVYEVFMACPHCGVSIAEGMKPDLNEAGQAIAPGQWLENGKVMGDAPDTDVYSLWVSGLCSPWRSWLVAVRRLLRAREAGNLEREQAIINTNFGQLYSIAGQAPPWEAVANLRQPIARNALPEDARVITCGVDVQKNRLVYVVRAWGQDMTSWGIDMNEIWGDTEYGGPWAKLGQLLGKTWDGVPIAAMFVDSGYRPGEKWKRPENVIYDFCRSQLDRCWPTKGHDTQDKPIRSARIDVVIGGRKVKDALELWHVNSDFFKAWVMARLEWPDDQPGCWMIHEEATDDYCKQVVSEVRVAQNNRIQWVKLRQDNHFLDAESLAIAAAYKLNLHIAMPPVRSGPVARQGGSRRRMISQGVR